jgi:hypothetical protein
MLAASLLAVLSISGQVNLPAARPVPRMQVLPLPGDKASVAVSGRQLSRYYFGHELRRPFLYPLVGPSGWSLTRAPAEGLTGGITNPFTLMFLAPVVIVLLTWREFRVQRRIRSDQAGSAPAHADGAAAAPVDR